jgi:hypothetical protein
MHVILSTQGDRRWISGIFLDAQRARDYLSSDPADGSALHELQSISPAAFPLFILEDRSGFTFLTMEDAVAVVHAMTEPAENADPILFAIVAEYRPLVPGRDEMGRLRHLHLDGRHLEELRASGLESLTR